MIHEKQNFTIVVNWKEKGFGCRKNCSYCSWRSSPLLPHGPQSAEAISTFIKQCPKDFVTLSGGGDSLYRFDENRDHLLAMIGLIKEHGFKVRIITREVEHIAKLRGIVDYFSISLDADVLDESKRYRTEWAGMDIEYSLVMPPVPTDDLITLKPQYAALHRILGRRLVLRENLLSIYPLDFEKLSFGHRNIVFVPKSLCLASRYLSTVDCTGHDIMQDTEGLANYLMGHPDVFLFGGFVRHLVHAHMDYGDIDLITVDPGLIDELSNRFGFAFSRTSPSGRYPAYFHGRPSRAGKPIQLILMDSASDALRFIRGGTYDADTLAYNNRFIFDPAIGEQATLQAINTKQLHRNTGQHDATLFSPDRPFIEQKHRLKLLRKGFTFAA